MWSDLVTFIGELFLCVEDFKFEKKKDKRRAFEKKHNLPRKQMISPVNRAYIIVSLIILGFSFLFFSFIKPAIEVRNTNEKLLTISYLLINDKADSQKYPEDLISIVRRNPTHGDLTLDSWENEIVYQQTKNGKGFLLFSAGKDGILNTDDDIIQKDFK